MTLSFAMPLWYDLHTHFRQDETLVATVQDHLKMGCMGALAMPNTKPPVGKVFKDDPLDNYKSIEEYKAEIMTAAASDGVGGFSEVIVPLYITQHTTPKMIEDGAKAGVLKACKYYPPHGTTGAEHGYPFAKFMENGVFKAMEDCGVTLCIHGEEHGLCAEHYFDKDSNAEEIFYREMMPRMLDHAPTLRMVGEHLTTKVGVDFIQSAPDHVKATVTPQHLLYTVGHLLQGLKYHLYCLPLVKFDADRAALRAACIDPDNSKFFAGTDSAPHTKKMTACGCAAGCYTGGIAPQLYAHAFEEAGADLSTRAGQDSFIRFMVTIGQAYYDLPVTDKTITLTKTPQAVDPLSVGEHTIIPLPVGMENELPWSLTV